MSNDGNYTEEQKRKHFEDYGTELPDIKCSDCMQPVPQCRCK